MLFLTVLALPLLIFATLIAGIIIAPGLTALAMLAIATVYLMRADYC